MPAKKPSRPWRLLHTVNGAVVETKHRSRPEADREVAAEKQRIADGISRVVRIRIEKWNVETGTWTHVELAHPAT
ncbi:hypothetical protein [Streptomyces californicus]|uniref:hypothetical protein n=1 Tax=Streptomyces californicus TaxID=67351 RepID=UPI003829D12F